VLGAGTRDGWLQSGEVDGRRHGWKVLVTWVDGIVRCRDTEVMSDETYVVSYTGDDESTLVMRIECLKAGCSLFLGVDVTAASANVGQIR
jgi:hypothetical protein